MENAWVEDLLSWYQKEHRALPWRQSRDPYRIWISEVMLQQTKVETVIPYYERFMSKFPALDDLASAPEDEVLKAWEGLGYYSRARHLHAAVKEVSAKYEGRVPEAYEDFRALPGVGDYTAGAVLSIGYDMPVPAVDGNVLRVYARYVGMNDNVLSARVQKRVREALQLVMPEHRSSDFNQALMELGALVCKPKAPRCDDCPLRPSCVAARLHMQHELPVRKKNSSTRVEHLAVLVLRAGNKWLVRKRPAQGLLANLWELPNVTVQPSRDEAGYRHELQRFIEQREITVKEFTWIGDYTHVFSHLTWQIKVYSSDTKPFEVEWPYRWMDVTERSTLAFGHVFSKILSAIEEG